MKKTVLFVAGFACLLFGIPPRLPAATLHAAPAAQAQQQKSQVFIGTILKKGDTVVFSDNNGITYRIDDVVDASQLIGKRVRIVGILDTKNALIHVESMEQIS